MRMGAADLTRLLGLLAVILITSELASHCGVLGAGCTDNPQSYYSGTKGNKFVLQFPRQFLTDKCRVYVVADGPTNISAYSAEVSMMENRTVSGPGLTVFDVDLQLRQTKIGKQTKYLLISADSPVSVFCFVFYSYPTSSYGYLAFPVDRWSTKYMVGSYTTPPMSYYHQVIVTAFADNTDVNFLISDGNMTTSTLKAFQSYNLVSEEDLSGTLVIASKPVSVLVGVELASIPSKRPSGDPLVDSPLPFEAWGTEYIVPSLPPKRGYIVRVFAESTTTVHYYNSTAAGVATVQDMMHLELLLGEDPLVISTSKPVMVVQFGLSQNYDSVNGDPFMKTVPSLTNFANNYAFPSPGLDMNFTLTVAITIKSKHKNGLFLDDKPIKAWKTVSVQHKGEDYVIMFTNIIGEYHTLGHTNTEVVFGALLYGLKRYSSYAVPLGMQFGYSQEPGSHVVLQDGYFQPDNRDVINVTEELPKTLTCAPHFFCPQSFSWYIGNILVQEDNRSTITFLPQVKDHGKRIYCVAFRPSLYDHTLQSSAPKLNFLGRPESPKLFLCTETSGSNASFLWVAGFNGGFRQWNILQYRRMGSDSWLNSSVQEELTTQADETVLAENRFVLSHLPPAEYEARLVAGNIKGEAAPVDLNSFTFHIVSNGPGEASCMFAPVIVYTVGSVLIAVIIMLVMVNVFQCFRTKGTKDTNNTEQVRFDDMQPMRTDTGSATSSRRDTERTTYMDLQFRDDSQGHEYGTITTS